MRCGDLARPRRPRSRSGSPPCLRTFARKSSRARPDAMALRQSASPSAASAATPPRDEHPSPEAIGDLHEVGRPGALEAVEALLDLEEIPDLETEGLAHVGDHADHPLAHRGARAHQAARERASALSGFFMNAPGPDLTSKTRDSAPSATFFDKIDAVMRGIDSTVPVTSRNAYSFLSAGDDLGRLPRHREAMRRAPRSTMPCTTGARRSIPFCQVSRLMTLRIAPSPGIRPKVCSTASRLARRRSME